MSLQQINAYLKEANNILSEGRSIVDRVKAEGRDITAAEKFDCEDKVKRANELIALAEKLGNEPVNVPAWPSRYGTSGHSEKRFLEKSDRFIDHVPGRTNETLSLARIASGLATGNWNGKEAERAALATTPNSSGGYALPLEVLGFVDFARDASVCVQAGARTIALDGKATIPVIASDPEGTWHAENAEESESDIVFEGRSLQPHTAYCALRGSVELFEDAAMLDVALTNALRGSLGLQLDRAMLISDGDSGKAPTGILHTSGVNVDSTATPISYDLISQACQTVANANGTANAAILCPRDYFILDRAVAEGGDEQTKIPFASYNRLSKYVTNSLTPNGSPPTSSTVVVGDFSKLVLGVRTDWRIEVSRQESTAWKKLQIAMRIYGRFDAALLQPSHFAVYDAVTAS
jgi:HK97 family phage major capsid protein